MKLSSTRRAPLLRGVLSVLSFSAAFGVTPVQAQRETFEGSNYIEETAIATGLSKKPEKVLERTGAGADGKRLRVKATEVAVSFDNIYFKLDSIEPRDKESVRQIEGMAAALQRGDLRSHRFLIEGHTCDLGETGYNLMLSARRANTVRTLLMVSGVAGDRLTVMGLGESEQIATPGPRADAAMAEKIRGANRRVVLRLLPTPPGKAPK